MPNFSIPFVSYMPDFMVAISMAPIALVTMAEHIGDHKALSYNNWKRLNRKIQD